MGRVLLEGGEESRGRRGGGRGSGRGRKCRCSRRLVPMNWVVGIAVLGGGNFHRKIPPLRRRKRRRGHGRCAQPLMCEDHGIVHFPCQESIALEKQGTYLDIILPGKATLTVHSLPLEGWNTAVGFEVSIEVVGGASFNVPLVAGLASVWRFRFYKCSVTPCKFKNKERQYTFAFVSPLPMMLKLVLKLQEFLGGQYLESGRILP
jgi:hypothetical protein